jgi:iron complex transport system substrate-binding protein
MTTTLAPPPDLDITADATRRQFLAMLGAVGLLAACGDVDERGSDDAAPTTRTVEGAYGPIEVPTDPQRIFADLMTVDYLTALGYDTSKIVGVFDAGYFRNEDGHYMSDFFANEDLVDPGYQYDMNLEVIAAARPDLILLPFDQIDGSEQFDELATIAPLLVVPTSDTRDPGVRYGGTASFQDWRSTLRAYGTLLEMEGAADDYVAETESQLDELTETHGELIASITATEAKSAPDFLAINALDTARTSGVLGTILMSELGFRSPPQQAAVTPDEYGTIELSAENADLVDGDLLFLEVRDGSTRHEESPLWSSLHVVTTGGVFVVGNHWEFGGAVGAREVISDIDAALTALASRR